MRALVYLIGNDLIGRWWFWWIVLYIDSIFSVVMQKRWHLRVTDRFKFFFVQKHKKTQHALVGLGSAVLMAAVDLPR